ncbi:hypothetical protein Tco_0394628 [Tanacetum coccineum]
MFLNMDQLEKATCQEEFQEIGSMAAFKVLGNQFQMFIKSRIYLDDEYVDMTRNKFLQYTQLAIPEFRDTLIQHMESVKKLIDERAQHKREYDSWVNERQIQTTEDKVDSSKALDASLVDTESSGTALKEQDTSSRSGNDAHADDADIRPIYDEEPMVEVQTTAEINIFATGQQHTEQPEFNNEGKVDQNAEQCHDTCPLPAKLTDNQTTELSNQSLESENIRLKKTVAQFLTRFFKNGSTLCLALHNKWTSDHKVQNSDSRNTATEQLISWQWKKQTVVANSITEAEYIAASSCCGQSTICIVKNPVFHSKTKHIEIRHHFIRDSNEKKLIQMIKIHTDQNVADLLTKAFDVSRFEYLIASIGMLNL